MADALTRLRSSENDVVCPCLDLRKAAATEIEQLRGNLSLAEEGLANYAQEVARLEKRIEGYKVLVRMTTTESERQVRQQLEEARLCLQGIASCGTCEVCRGAANLVLHPTGNGT